MSISSLIHVSYTSLQTYITDRTFTCTVGGVPKTVDLPSECDTPATAVPNASNNVTIAECASSCQNGYLRNQTNLAVSTLSTIQEYFDVLDEIEAALNCRFVFDAFQSGKTTICTTFMYVLSPSIAVHGTN